MGREILFRGRDLKTGEIVTGFYAKVNGSDVILDVENLKPTPVYVAQEYVASEDFYEGDILCGAEYGEWGEVTASWKGLVAYDKNSGRIRVLEENGDWFELDDFSYERVCGRYEEGPEKYNEEIEMENARKHVDSGLTF